MKLIKPLASAVLPLLSVSLLLSTSWLQALELEGKSPQEQGYAVAAERKQRDSGWQDSQSSVIMTLRNAQGEESVREMRMKSLEVQNDGDKGLTIFDQPRDVKGTAFLSFSHVNKADDQWLYLPALKRVKRIASRNKSGPFMGSEFSYEDLSSFELEKYQFTLLGEESVNGLDCYKVEQIPTDKYSGYTRQIVWLDKTEFRAQKVEFYDRKKSLLKTLTFADYQQYLDQYWRPLTMLMVNHQTKKSTDLKTLSLEFKTGLKDSDFNKATLKRAR
ncbi:outer membrane lipoprotein-sorting protein [Bacterioplanoides sp. SCSIO 12839]|uniref:outer membrane lipoprotein-sorting protein n=1 Tax=Bacterioplanoides sp. SCSIO 12839 TaxID=2829569 RepID=UPI002103F02E|nr:outer membrane lipoprotein-sorting protein [Bacterioplanoides sp. SCSIO 12839]UTW49294.1 outer membrane lipoprotein-sorting protein [Bacterioplanoides sp. SCSIO 12839]